MCLPVKTRVNRLTSSDTVVAARPAVLWGLMAVTTADGVAFALMNSQVEDNAKRVLQYIGTSNESQYLKFEPALVFDDGLYFDAPAGNLILYLYWNYLDDIT